MFPAQPSFNKAEVILKKTKTHFVIIIMCAVVMAVFAAFRNENALIACNTGECSGQYEGPEFVKGADVAHQFSNKMAERVGDKLKELFKSGVYSKVDFDGIEMTTEGMGSGSVIYYLKIPFIRVKTKCEARTSFDHVGGWNHSPALNARKKQLASALMPNDKLYISELKSTEEGLEEYWIQWRNKTVQAGCN